MLHIYNLAQTGLYSDMQIGEPRGQKHSDKLTRVRQCPQSQLGGFKISWGGYGEEGRGGTGECGSRHHRLQCISKACLPHHHQLVILHHRSAPKWRVEAPSESPKEALRRDRWKQALTEEPRMHGEPKLEYSCRRKK